MNDRKLCGILWYIHLYIILKSGFNSDMIRSWKISIKLCEQNVNFIPF